MSYPVRPMQNADLPRVESIYRQNVGNAPPSQWLSIATRAIEEPDEAPLALVVTESQGNVIGYIVGEIRSWEFGSESAGWVTGIGVDTDYRNGGVGRILLGAIVRSFTTRGVRTVRTMARRDDVPVLRFFRSSGFTTGPYTEMEMELKS